MDKKEISERIRMCEEELANLRKQMAEPEVFVWRPWGDEHGLSVQVSMMDTVLLGDKVNVLHEYRGGLYVAKQKALELANILRKVAGR